METETVPSAWHLDTGLPGRHFGLIALDSDQTTERDFMTMKPEGVSFYTARVRYAEANTLENLRAVGGRLGDAASLILPGTPLDAIAYSCTAGTVALGYEETARNIHSTRPHVPVVTPMTAAFRAFEHLGISRVSLLTPYRQSVADLMADFIIQRGFIVLNSASFLLRNSSELPRLTPASISAAALEVCRDDADALFISCTGVRAVELLDDLEQRLGKTVLSSNQCMFWECLQHCGHRFPIQGCGRLLRSPPPYESRTVQ
jgi:maleate isomerase